MDILVTGAAGRLGGAIAAEMTAAGHSVTALRRSDLDVTNGVQVGAMIERLQPDVIVNCSAYNAVDEAETNRETAFAVNAHGPSLLAAAARRTSA
jgi:dTDP-4-dehydrorhamnose reductase